MAPSLPPLTTENLEAMLEGPRTPTISCHSGAPNKPSLELLKRWVFSYMKDLSRYAQGRQLLQTDDLQIVNNELCYRGDGVQPEDPSFWDTKRQFYRDRYTDILAQDPPDVRIRRAKITVYNKMMELQDHGPFGRSMLRDGELCLTSDGTGVQTLIPEPSAEYWEAKVRDLEAKVAQAARAPMFAWSEDEESLAELRHNEEYRTGWKHRKSGIEAWANSLPSGAPSEISYPSSAQGDHLDRLEDCYTVKLDKIRTWVYLAMLDLIKSGEEGRRIIENDELIIIADYDVRYRGTSHIRPDLCDLDFWESKLRYFESQVLDCRRHTRRQKRGSHHHDPDDPSEMNTSSPYKRRCIQSPGLGLTMRTSPPRASFALASSPSPPPARRRPCDVQRKSPVFFPPKSKPSGLSRHDTPWAGRLRPRKEILGTRRCKARPRRPAPSAAGLSPPQETTTRSGRISRPPPR